MKRSLRHDVTLSLLVFLSVCLGVAKPGRAAEDNQAQTVSYSKDIEPILRTHCQGCHQPAKAQGSFALVSYADLLKAGESGEPGDRSWPTG